VKDIHLIVTGGTFDKKYDPVTGTMVLNEKSCIPDVIRESRTEEHINFHVEEIKLKDSLEMTDIAKVLGTCRDRSLMYKRIILIGAFIPYSMKSSDALFNFGMAVGSMYHINDGVYVAMNGLISSWKTIKKDKSKGIFTWSK
jgi:L-asparaginase